MSHIAKLSSFGDFNTVFFVFLLAGVSIPESINDKISFPPQTQESVLARRRTYKFTLPIKCSYCSPTDSTVPADWQFTSVCFERFSFWRKYNFMTDM